MGIYSLLASLGALYVASHIVETICNTKVALSYHHALIRMTEVNNLSQMEIVYDRDTSSMFSNDDDGGDGFLN